MINWPRKIDVTINYGEDAKGDSNRQETSATLLRSVETYGEFGPMAEYESASGLRFWIEGEYFQTCQDTKKLPDIPIEVIAKNEAWYEKKEMGESLIAKQAVEKETGLVLPEGYQIPKV
jgi:hypothetical protein